MIQVSNRIHPQYSIAHVQEAVYMCNECNKSDNCHFWLPVQCIYMYMYNYGNYGMKTSEKSQKYLLLRSTVHLRTTCTCSCRK